MTTKLKMDVTGMKKHFLFPLPIMSVIYQHLNTRTEENSLKKVMAKTHDSVGVNSS